MNPFSEVFEKQRNLFTSSVTRSFDWRAEQLNRIGPCSARTRRRSLRLSDCRGIAQVPADWVPLDGALPQQFVHDRSRMRRPVDGLTGVVIGSVNGTQRDTGATGLSGGSTPAACSAATM